MKPQQASDDELWAELRIRVEEDEADTLYAGLIWHELVRRGKERPSPTDYRSANVSINVGEFHKEPQASAEGPDHVEVTLRREDVKTLTGCIATLRKACQHVVYVRDLTPENRRKHPGDCDCMWCACQRTLNETEKALPLEQWLL